MIADVIILILALLFIKWILGRIGKAKFQVTSVIVINNFKIKTEGKAMVQMQQDQEFDIELTYADDDGQPTNVESIVSSSSNVSAIFVTEPEQISTGVYKCTVAGLPDNFGSADITIDADARFGEEVRTISYVLAVTTTPNEAEGVSAVISEIRNQ